MKIDPASLSHGEIATRLADFWPKDDRKNSPQARLLQEAARRLNHLQAVEDHLFLYYLNGDIPSSMLASLCGLEDEDIAPAVKKFCQANNIKPMA